MEGAKQFIGKGLKTKSDVTFYANVDDLCLRLAELHAAKKAENNGLDNMLNSILDELLKVGAITKDEYAVLYKSISHII